MLEAEQARYEVAVFENQIELLTSVHMSQSAAVDWQSIAEAPEPPKPVHSAELEKAAKEELNTYKPGILTRLFGREEDSRRKLQQKVQLAREHDEENYRQALEHFEAVAKQWDSDKDLANRVLRKEPEAQIEAIRRFDPFCDIAELGSSLDFVIDEGSDIPEITVHVHSDSVIPKEEKRLLKSGKLSYEGNAQEQVQ